VARRFFNFEIRICGTRFGAACVAIGIFLLAPLMAGCPVTTRLPGDAPVQTRFVHETDAKYYLYVPERYSDRRRWPLVVLCHGTNPWDTAWSQMREWAGFAEEKGIIVVAPHLVGVRGDFPPSPEEQLKFQREDERTILGVVSAIKAGHRIADEAVFLCGWSAGGYAVLYTGLRNPDVFRALAVRQSNFDAAYMSETEHALDRYQPIFMSYGMADLVRKQSEAAIAWLRERGMCIEEHQTLGAHRRIDVSGTWDRFRDVSEDRPWIRVHASVPDYKQPRNVQFSVRAAPKATSVQWDFGDGLKATSHQPLHSYEADGTYTVTAHVTLEGGKTFRRVIEVRAPRIPVGVAAKPTE